MLILTRKAGEAIRIGELVTVTVLATGRNRVRLGFSGPNQVPVVRGELTGTVAPRSASAVPAARAERIAPASRVP